MGGILSLRGKPAEPAADPARVALASAIEALKIAEAEAQTKRAAVDRGQRMVALAQERLTAARLSTEKAREDQVARMRAGQDAIDGSGGLREARAHEADMVDGLAIAQTIMAEAEAPIGDVEYAEKRARREVEAACDRVLIEALPVRLEDVRALRDELFRRCGALQFIGRLNAANSPHFDRELSVRTDIFVENVRRLNSHTSSKGSNDYPNTAEWQAVRDALMRDAYAPLPEVV